ncbi:MAG: hypothetical protein ACR2QV_11335 [Gammaproteobacteria bacterium]
MASGSGGNLGNLVDAYAKVGMRRRRERASLIVAVALLVPIAALLAALAWNQGVGTVGFRPVASSHQLEELERLTQSLATEVRAISGQREQFTAQQELFQQQSSLLAEELSAITTQRNDLEEQRFAFQSQGRRMADAIANIDSRRATIEKQQQEIDRQAPMVDRELAAMRAERDRLEERRREYAEQGEMLSVEIAAINEQRRELAKQRLQVEKQRKEIQILLEQTREIQSRLMNPDGYGQGPDSPMLAQEDVAPADIAPDDIAPVDIQVDVTEAATVAVAESRQQPTIDGLTAVEDGQLSNMRGGIDIGGDMVIDIGVTRSASINGVEQYSSTLQFEDIAGGQLSPSDLAAVGGVLIQSGAGNVAPVDLIDSSTGNFLIIQNSRDYQEIATENVYDISVDNVSSTIEGIAAGQAIDSSLLLAN